MSPSPAPALRTLGELLSAAEVALDREDVHAAARAVEAAARACSELGAAGGAADRAEAARLSAQRARVERRAVELRDAIGHKLGDLAQSRRAVAAYRRR